MKRYFSFTGLLLLLIVQASFAQVTISPTQVFLDPNTKVGNFYVSNPSGSAVEVRLAFEFAYPMTDENGNISFNYDDADTETQRSLVPYLRAFPTTFVLQPDQRQTIRLVGRLPNDLGDGLFWSRMRVSSSQLTPPIGEATDGGVTAQVSFQFDQVTAVFVQNGNSATGLTIHGTEASKADGRLTILTDVERTGNSPFLGSVRTRILDNANNVVDERRSSTSVYFRNKQRVEFDAVNLSPGTYTIETTFESQRNDISSQNLLQIPNVTDRTTVRIE
jgi:hypothetical protein